MIANILIIALVVLFTVIGEKRGFAKTLANFAGILITAVVSSYLADFLSQFIYDSFLKETVVSNLQQIIQQNGIDYAVSNCFDAVPTWIMGMISAVVGLFGTTTQELQGSLKISEGMSVAAAQSIEATIQPVVTSIFSSLLMIVLFLILIIIVKKLLKLVLKVFNIPVIKQINQLLGGLLGFAEGCVIVLIAVNIFYAVMIIADNSLINNEMVTGSLFNLFCLLN